MAIAEKHVTDFERTSGLKRIREALDRGEIVQVIAELEAGQIKLDDLERCTFRT